MTVADLIRDLQALPQHWRVVIPMDCERDWDADESVEVEEVIREQSRILLRGE